MSKKRFESNPTVRPNPPKPSPPQSSSRGGSGLPWHVAWRCLVSLFVALHLTAVFSAPWDLATQSALPPGYMAPQGQPDLPPANSSVWQRPAVTRALRSFFSHYLNLAYLNHGYEFFAPDPAGTHVINYRVTRSDGSTVEGQFPDLKEQWPRLLYHRHMMLAEQTEMMGRESGLHYADYLATLHSGTCRLEWAIHFLLSPQRVLDGTPLDAPSTYQVIASLNGNPRRGASNNASSGELPVVIPGGGR